MKSKIIQDVRFCMVEESELEIGKGYGWVIDDKAVLEYRGEGYDTKEGCKVFNFITRYYNEKPTESTFTSLVNVYHINHYYSNRGKRF